MAVHVTMFPLLAKRTKSRLERQSLPYRDGLRPLDILRDEGFSETDTEAIMVLVNERQADLEAPIRDGDRLEFMIAIAGGAEWRPIIG